MFKITIFFDSKPVLETSRDDYETALDTVKAMAAKRIESPRLQSGITHIHINAPDGMLLWSLAISLKTSND